MRLHFFLLISCFVGGSIISNAQTLGNMKSPLPDALIDRYKLDFEIVGLAEPTAELLEVLDLDQYEELRLPDVNVEVYDAATDFHIILYAVNDAIANYNRQRHKTISTE